MPVSYPGAGAESKSKTSWGHVGLKNLVSVVLEDVVDMSRKISFFAQDILITLASFGVWRLLQL